MFLSEVDGTPYFSAFVYTNNQFQFTVNGWTGTNYVMQATTNLATTNWISLATNAAPFTFTQSNANSFGQRTRTTWVVERGICRRRRP